MDDHLEFVSNHSIIVFNEQQKSNIGAALQALADKIVPAQNGQQLASTETNHTLGGLHSKSKTENCLKPQFLETQINETFRTPPNIYVSHNIEIKKEPSFIEENYIKNFSRCIEKDTTTLENVDQVKVETADEPSTVLDLANENYSLQNINIGHSKIDDKLVKLPNSIEYYDKSTSDISSYLTLTKEEPQILETQFYPPHNVKSNDSDSIDVISGDDMNNHHDNIKKSIINYRSFILYSCPECGVECGTYFKWKSHIEMEHKSNTTTWLNMNLIKNEDGKLCYQCLDCDENLTFTKGFSILQHHRIKHLPYKDYMKCRLCDKRYYTISSLYSHIKKTHDHLDLPNSEKRRSIEFLKIFCPICKQTQLNISSWWQHLALDHNFNNKIKNQAIRINERMYSCQLCLKNVSECSLKLHMLIHEPIISFQCSICKKFEARPEAAKRHVRSHFQNDQEKIIECSYCNATFPNKLLLQKHSRKSHKNDLNNCTVCDAKFASAKLLMSHMKYTHETDVASLTKNELALKTSTHENETKNTSRISYKESINNRRYTVDVDSNDSEKGPSINSNNYIHYICPECNIECGSYSKWKSHTVKQHKANTTDWLNLRSISNGNDKLLYECLDCNKTFSIKTQFKYLKHHRISHLRYKAYMKCRLCNKRFNSMRGTQIHIKTFHAEIVRSTLKKTSSMKYIKIVCPICQEQQLNLNCWRQHLAEKHDYENKVKSQVATINGLINMYSCRICKQQFSDDYAQDHMLKHESHRAFQCTLCYKRQTRPRLAMQHVSRHFPKNEKKQIGCSHCEATFAKETKLLQHYRNCHKNKLIKCSICNEEFLNNSRLLSHIKITGHSL